MTLLEIIKDLLWFISFGPIRAKRERIKRRKNYDEIRAMIIDRHYDGKGGLVIPSKYDLKDVENFTKSQGNVNPKLRMYFSARDEKNRLILFWQEDLMTKEIGPPKVSAQVVAKAVLDANVAVN